MEKKISVIMATYNCEKTIEKAIESIMAQTYTNWIFIICDDGSTDNTKSILMNYAQQMPDRFIILENDKNMKLPFSLNRCLAHVNTELVARMDGDDWSTPDRFEKQVAFLSEHPEYDLVGTAMAAHNGVQQIGSVVMPPIPLKECMLFDNAFCHATIMTYKRVYDELGGYSLDPSVLRVEDVDLWFRFFAAGFNGFNLQEELYVILEDINAVKRRTFRARLNSARTRSAGAKLIGITGPRRYLPYLLVLKAFVPAGIYRMVHNWLLKRKSK